MGIDVRCPFFSEHHLKGLPPLTITLSHPWHHVFFELLVKPCHYIALSLVIASPCTPIATYIGMQYWVVLPPGGSRSKGRVS